MIVTRTARFTDWLFQAAHAGETEATYGVGLLSGHIYYRYSHDFLKDGEEVQREKSFIHLSDGSEYELGTGLSSEKITVIYHGTVSDGSVHIEVQGRPEIGVGVQSIQRSVTIAYDDGKVPVLDTDQLNGIMAELHDSLSESMVNTAEAVKEELRTELNTIGIEVKQECEQKTSTLRVEVQEADKAITTRLNNIGSDVDSMRDELSKRINILSERSTRICGWGHSGFYTAHNNNSWVNFLGAAGGDVTGNTTFLSREGDRIKIVDGVKGYDRVLRITVTGVVGFPDAGEGSCRVRLSARRGNGDVIAEDSHYFTTSGGESFANIQFNLALRLHANDDTNPLLADGVFLSFARTGSKAARLTNPGVTCVMESTI